MSVQDIHEERETLAVDINIPGHDPRTTTSLFTRTKKQLLARDGARCFICGCPASEVGPLEAHHYPIERSMAEMIDWSEGSAIRAAFPHFDWASFDPADPYKFVDDMTWNGLLLCKTHHTGKDAGIHMLPHPLWIAQKFGREGYQFSAAEVLHHEL